MQFTYTKNSPRGAEILGLGSSPLKRRKSRGSVQQMMETPRIRRSQTAGVYAFHGNTHAEFPESLETESQAFLSTQRTRKMSTEPLAEIKELIESKDEGNLFSLEDGRETKLEFQKLQVLDWGLAIVTIIVAFLVVVTYDLEFEEYNGDLAKVFLWAIFALNLICISMTLLRYLQNLRYLKARNFILQKATLWSSGHIWYLLIEVVVILIQPYPFSRGIKVQQYDGLGGVDYFYHVNDFFSLLLVLRVYIIGRFILNNLMYRSPRSHRIGNMYGAESGYIYACRSIMKVNPITGVLLLLTCSIVVFGYMIRVCERPLNRNPTVIIEFDSYWNAMWCVILTMTTVGYGDIYARTMLGRTVSLLVCIWGTFVVSIMVVTLTNILTMSNVEEKSLMILRRLEARKRQKEEAAYVLTNIAKIALLRRRRMNKQKQNEETKEVIRDLKRHLNTFKKTSRQIKGLDDSVGPSEEVTRQIRFVGEDIKTLMEAQAKLQQTVNDYIMYSQATKYPGSLFVIPESKSNFNKGADEDAIIHKAR